ncbi:MAG: CoA transferase [Thermodesulfobacteriota bacterium]|nr:CoA transferase [Thermodesulfobacteriota bacterium]
MNQTNKESLLGNTRALDLTDDKGFLCGKILGELGCDVIKIEPPGGDPARRIGPFHHDTPHPEKSLLWLAYNTSKRSITLSIESKDGMEIFRRLVKTADFIIESFPPGRMDNMGLGYPELSRIDPRIILTSITPFGQNGPYRDYKAPDIVGVALGGLLYMTGDPDRPPVRIGLPQAYLHAAAEAAVGTMIAYYHRERIGEGQWVDVSIQHSLISTLANFIPIWEQRGIISQRVGSYRTGLTAGARQRQVWRCKDGYVCFGILAGTVPRSNRSMVEWMDSEGMADEYLKEMNWDNFDMFTLTQEIQDRIEEPISRFFLKHTKEELYEEAIRRRIMLYPVSTPQDLMENPQLKSRDFWVEVEYPHLKDTIKTPGAFVKASETPCQIKYPAPCIGEHNQEIYQGELSFSEEELVFFKQAGVI